MNLRSIVNVITDVRTSLALAETPAVRRLLYAQLGSIRFNVVGPVTGLETKRVFGYAQHEVIDGKPRLQSTSDDLDVITLTLRFLSAISDPVTAYADLCEAAARKEALPLVFASGEVKGRYVISEIGDTYDHTEESGRVTQRTTRVTLTEFVEAKVLEVQSQKRKVAAKAAVAEAPKKAAAKKLDPTLDALRTATSHDQLEAMLRKIDAAKAAQP